MAGLYEEDYELLEFVQAALL